MKLPLTKQEQDAARYATAESMVKGLAALFVIGLGIYWVWPKPHSAPTELDRSSDAMATVSQHLRDPASAQFRGVATHRSMGVTVVCGEVNGENGFGGYSGYERFVSAGDKVYFEHEMGLSKMGKLVAVACQ